MTRHPPVVLAFSGHDPSGGAGVQADIETLLRLGCHAGSVITALTEQDTVNVRRILPQRAADFLRQARCVLADLPVAVIKIGLLADAAIAQAIRRLLEERPKLPVVLDPILAAGGGKTIASDELLRIIVSELLPKTTLLTPNLPEARRLSGRSDPDECAAALLSFGCRHVLLTGTHDDTPDVVNRFYAPGVRREFRWPRLPETYHGSGCTLASAAAGLLAQGQPMETVVREAQRFTFESLSAGFSLGKGQWLPDRRAPNPPAA